MQRFLNPANVATLLRLGLAPYVAGTILQERYLLAVTIFFIAGLTDIIDGGLARRYGWATPAGAYLDPIADKVLLSTVYICLAMRRSIPWWFVAILFGRDLLILAASGAALLFTGVRRFPPSVWGKFSTFLQLLTAGAWMVRNAFPLFAFDSIARGLIWPTAAATVWSGLHYGWRGMRILRTH
jgi:cardiolipin synthase